MHESTDTHFGPQLPGQFDFTLFFEQVMMAIVPASIIAMAIPFYLRTAVRSARYVRSGYLLWAKLAIGVSLIAVHTATVVLWQMNSLFRSNLALGAAIMSLFASMSITAILYVAHTYSLQPSGFLSVFLSITILFDITVVRSAFRRDGLGAIGALQIAVAILKFVLVLLEEVPKRDLFITERLRRNASSEAVSGFWTRALFLWLNPLMIGGFRQDLTIEGLPDVDEEFDSGLLFDRFTPHWNRVDKSSSWALIKALVLTVSWELFIAVIPRLAFVGFKFSQPFLLLRIVAAVTSGDTHGSLAHGLVAATALVFFGISITRAVHEHMQYRITTSIRGMLVVSIYDKMFRLGHDQLEEFGAVTLMTTDTNGVKTVINLLYEVVSAFIQVGLGIWSLSLFVGPACLLMFIPGICSFLASMYLGKKMAVARALWNGQIESRVAATSNVLAQIKDIKLMGLAGTVTKYLQEKREAEMVSSREDRKARLWLFAFSAMNGAVTPVLVLAGAYFGTRASDPMSVAEVFTILGIVAIAAEPFLTLLQCIMGWSAGVAAIGRIQRFLILPEKEDQRVVSDSSALTNGIVPIEKSSSSGSQATRFSIQFANVTARSGTRSIVLRNVSFRIPKGNIAIIWGPISCGKSSLLRCILGETKVDSGTVAVETKSIGYCSQETWIQNCTLISCVIGVLDLVPSWYREVIVACALDTDIAALSNGEETMTGSGGCNLSGGQKQRLSMARAVYAQEDIIVIDDAFSAMDPETAEFVYHSLFGSQGLTRRWNCTVFMSTNRLEFLESADMNFQMRRDGSVTEEQRHLSDESSPPESSDGSGEEDGSNSAITQQPNPHATELPSVVAAEPNPLNRLSRDGRSAGDWALYGYLLQSAGTFWVIFWVCFVAFAAVMEAIPLIFLRVWYSVEPENHFYFIGYALFAVSNIAFNTIAGAQYFFQIVPRSSEELHLRMSHAVLFASMQYLSHIDTGSLLNRFSEDMSEVSQELPLAFMQFAFMFFSVIAEVAIIASGSKYTAPIMVFIFVVIFLVQTFYLRTSRQLRFLELESSEGLFTHFTETSLGMLHIRSFDWRPAFREKLFATLNRSQKPFYILFCCQRWLTLVLDVTATAAATILVLLSMVLPKSTTDSGLGLALLTLIGFSSSAAWLITAWTSLETGLGSISRIKSFCEETPQEKDNIEGLGPPALPDYWPPTGRIDFNCVSANYCALNGRMTRALDSLAVELRAGETVGVVGRSGSGKSTMFQAMLRMCDYTGGISIDGRDIKTVPRELLRSLITTVTQDGVILKGSLRLNVYPFPGRQPTDQQIQGVLQSVGILNHVLLHGSLQDDIVSMCFTRSQKQLLFIARAILHHRTNGTKIVLLDEATSALTDETDGQIQALLEQAFSQSTVLQIAHRSTSTNNADVVMRLQAGTLVSLQRRNGLL